MKVEKEVLMSNLNCRWATAAELAHIVDAGLVPEIAPPKVATSKVAAPAEGEAAAVVAVAEVALPEATPDFSWAAMISPPRTALLGTEKVFALMGPRESDEGEARQVDLSQPEGQPAPLSAPSKWRWQRLGADIVLLGSGVTHWARLHEGMLPR